ncbi:MAG: hypothetical protein J7M30_02415 [Deltaproteobacteria bacterium]|nr:hypothetical protein [Deltaproteobacteria bacterium]
METIQAKVSERLLSKASRLFTGTLEGRVIEILQNSRRAGATHVNIINKDGFITVCDNGSGIEDFSKLLHLGDSDWDDAMEKSEDPAGVGVFCLAPRELTICSGNKKVCINEKAWTGEPVTVQQDGDTIKGTTLVFKDEPWEFATVEKHAVFTGLTVTVDGKECARKHFCSKNSVDYPALGYRIEVRTRNSLNQWHRDVRRAHYFDDILVNFHGQSISFAYSPVSESELVCLVDMTGDATGIRMMLPARTRPVENKAFEELKSAIEIEAYRFIQKRGSHKLPFKEYERAAELGIKLPEADPVFQVGLLSGDTPEPIEVVMPKGFPLRKCYRFNDDCGDIENTDEDNVHLLAATGQFEEPFVPVNISKAYDGYSWTDLPTIGKVKVTVGKERGRQGVWSETLVAVDSLHITAHTSDGKVFESDVPMAVLDQVEDKRYWFRDVYVTLDARSRLCSTDIWYFCGGWSDEGDTYDTQLYYFEQDLEQFWAGIIGPGQYLRAKICECLFGIVTNWQRITIDADQTVSILYKDGMEKVFKS